MMKQDMQMAEENYWNFDFDMQRFSAQLHYTREEMIIEAIAIIIIIVKQFIILQLVSLIFT